MPVELMCKAHFCFFDVQLCILYFMPVELMCKAFDFVYVALEICINKQNKNKKTTKKGNKYHH